MKWANNINAAFETVELLPNEYFLNLTSTKSMENIDRSLNNTDFSRKGFQYP